MIIASRPSFLATKIEWRIAKTFVGGLDCRIWPKDLLTGDFIVDLDSWSCSAR